MNIKTNTRNRLNASWTRILRVLHKPVGNLCDINDHIYILIAFLCNYHKNMVFGLFPLHVLSLFGTKLHNSGSTGTTLQILILLKSLNRWHQLSYLLILLLYMFFFWQLRERLEAYVSWYKFQLDLFKCSWEKESWQMDYKVIL